MAKLPQFNRFTLEDFPDQRSWIGKLFEILNRFMTSIVSAFDNQLTHQENMLAQLGVVKISTKSTLTRGLSYATATTKTFIDANVTPATDVIAITSHGFQTGDQIRLTSSGTLPAGLALATDYFVIFVTTGTLKLASSYSNAISGTAVDITAAAGGGTHTVTFYLEMPPYAELFTSYGFKVIMKAKPVGNVIWSCVEASTTPGVLHYGVTVDWRYDSSNGQVVLNHVSGLAPNKSYNLVMLASGG